MTQLLEMVDRPGVVGFQADMAHTLLYTMGYNAPEDRILPEGYDWQDQRELDKAMEALTAASVALLTLYDMAKALDRAMVLGDIRLREKSGGGSGDWRAE